MGMENVVIGYTTDMSDVKRQLKIIQKQNQILARTMGKDFAKGATIVKSELVKIKTLAKGIKLPLGGVSKEVKTFSTIIRGANGQLVTLKHSTAGTGKNIKEFNQSVTKGAAGARTFGQNLATLAKRAALTIPLWFALRQGIGSVFRTIKEGITSIIDFDRALQKLRRNVEATSTSIDKDMANIAATITKFSLKTGKSVESITNAIQKFATVGFDVETSLQGGLNATKLAITLFGEVEGTAQAFARSLRVMTENIDSAEGKQKAIAEALALTDQLWQKNAFDVDEFSQNLTKFAGTANIANLSIEDTLTLLATLSTGGLANRAGRLLRSTLLRALQDIDKVTRTLDLDFDSATGTTIDFILKLVESLKKLRTTNTIPEELTSILGELFTVRSTEVVASLVSLEKTLKENIALTPNVAKLNSTFEGLLETPQSLAEQFTNLNREMGKAFVNGVIGAENFDKSLKTLINTQAKLNKNMEKVGEGFRNAFISAGVAGISLLTLKYGGLLALLATPIAPAVVAGIFAYMNLSFVSQINRLEKESKQADKILLETGKNVADAINKGFRDELSVDELDALLAKIEGVGDVNLGFGEGNLDQTIIELEKILTKQKEIAEEGAKNLKRVTTENVNNKKRKEIQEIILKNELSILRARGTTNSELLITEQILRKNFGIEKTVIDQLKDRLNLQRELNEEKQLETTLSARTKKLAEIARTEGIDTARKIGDVLSGAFDFDLFERIGGKNLEVFKKEFGDIFKEQQDIKFLKGKGFSITVDQKDITKIRSDTGRITTRANREQLRAEIFEASLKKNDISIDRNSGFLNLNTIALQGLQKIWMSGGTVTGKQILHAQKVDSTITIDLNISGENLSMTGTPEELRTGAQKMAPHIIPIIEKAIAHTLETNNSAPISKATDGRINKF